MRKYSLAYLTACQSTTAEAIGIAATLGYSAVGLRIKPNAPGAPFQSFIDDVQIQRETLARMADTGVTVYDIEIIRIGELFDPLTFRPLLEAGAALKARAVLVAADDDNESRLAQHFAQLCELTKTYGMTADLEFMPWTGVKDAKAAMRVLHLAGFPSHAGILVDALHFGRSTTSLEDIANIPSNLLHYAQMCDASAGLNFSTEEMIHTARQARQLPGEGNIDLKGLFAALPNDIPVSIEIPDMVRSQAMGDMAWAKKTLQATQEILGDAFGL
jgi:sugar phosphate isomerase/epimerase